MPHAKILDKTIISIYINQVNKFSLNHSTTKLRTKERLKNQIDYLKDDDDEDMRDIIIITPMRLEAIHVYSAEARELENYYYSMRVLIKREVH